MPATLVYPVCLPWPQRAADRKEALATERGAEIDALKEKLTSARKDVGEARQRAGARSRDDATLYVHLAYNIHLPVSDSVHLACASIRATPAMQVSAGAHTSTQVSTHIHTHKMLRNRHRSHTSAGCVVEATGRADLVVLEANARAELRTRALTAELDDLRTSAERASMRRANQHGPTQCMRAHSHVAARWRGARAQERLSVAAHGRTRASALIAVSSAAV